MPQETKHFTVSDPTTFDGDPFEVAERAMRQAGAVAGVLRDALEGAYGMVQNAEMERQIYATGDADVKAFEKSPQARRLGVLIDESEAIVKACAVMARAAGFNPKHPPKES